MKRTLSILFVILIVYLSTVFLSCTDSVDPNPIENCAGEIEVLVNEIRNDLDNYNTDTDFTLLIKSDDGKTFVHSTGNSSEFFSYRSASTSKWVSAVVILSLVEEGILSLDDPVQNYIPGWPTTRNLANIRLRDLLTFTSGFTVDPLCLNLPNFNFKSCIGRIVEVNTNTNIPGNEFYYSSSHLQVAGLMAIQALNYSSWDEVFQRFKSQTGLFTNSLFDLPSLENPRLAGGMHWTASEYLEFLGAIYNEDILTSELIDLMTSDQINGASIGNSPALDGIGEDWHYGFGNWIECHAKPNNCSSKTKVSSPGAFGAYPFIDYENKYYGILAREGALGSFDKGYELFEFISPKLKTWARVDCP